MLTFGKRDKLITRFKNQYVNDAKTYWDIMQNLPTIHNFLVYLIDKRLINEKEVEKFLNDRNA